MLAYTNLLFSNSDIYTSVSYIVQGGGYSPQSLPLFFKLLMQQFSAPPGLSVQPVPPHAPHDAGQQYFPVQTIPNEISELSVVGSVADDVTIGDMGDSDGRAGDAGESSSAVAARDGNGDGDAGCMAALGDGDTGTARGELGAISSAGDALGDEEGLEDGLLIGEGLEGMGDIFGSGVLVGFAASPLPEVGASGRSSKAAATIAGVIFSGMFPFWYGLDTAQKDGPVQPVLFGHSPGSSAAVWHFPAFAGLPVYEAPSYSPVSPASQNG